MTQQHCQRSAVVRAGKFILNPTTLTVVVLLLAATAVTMVSHSRALAQSLMRMLKLLLFGAALAFSLEAAGTPTCTSFVYVNGINTSNIQAAGTVTDLLVPQFRTYLANTGKAGNCYSIHLSYNASVWWPKDLAESARLFLNQDSSALDRFINHGDLFQGATTTEQTALTFAITTTPVSGLVSVLGDTQVANSTATIINRLPPSEQVTTGALVNRLLAEINAGKTAVCVGHSEGNFYCNLAYKLIAEDDPATFRTLSVTQSGLSKLGLSLPDSRVLQIVGIAVPAGFVADGRHQYLTDCQDPITAVPKSLIPNYGTCVSSWRDSFWKGTIGGTVIYWLDAIGKLFLESTLSFEAHRIETYLTDGTEKQKLIMQMLAQSLIDSDSTTQTYVLDSNICDVAWITNIFYQLGQHDADMRIGGWGDWYYSLFKCRLANLPVAATKAEIRFYKYPEGGTRSQIYLDRVTSPWDNNTKWPTKPSSVNISVLPQPIDANWYVIDLTDLYNAWQQGYPNYGIMLRPASNANDVHNTFRSSEYTDPKFRPQLVVTYTAASAPRNTPPRITLSGANPVNLTVGALLVEPGYAATDAEDGNITAKVTVSGTVNTFALGTYTLIYNVTDSAGAAAVPQTRTVNVLASSSSSTVTYPLNSDICNVAWVTNVYYGGGQHDGDMRVGGFGDWYDSLLKCTLSGFPSSAVKVVLRMYEYPSPSGGTRGQMYLDRVTSPWDNSTKWSTKPSATNISMLPSPVDNQWYEVDITDLYNGWQSGSIPNYGIMLRPVANNNIFDVFRSTDYSDPAFRPQLVLTAASPGFSSLTPTSITTSTAGYVPSLLAGGANFTNLTQIRFSWSGATSGSATWIKGDANWPSKVTVSSDTSMTLRPTVTTAGDPAGITSWNVTLVDSTGATAARSFTVTYTPTMALGFTGLSPNAISTSTAGYVPSLLAGGANFTNLTQIRFSWSGATSGSATWIKGDANWPSKVTVSSDTSMTLRPTVTTAGDPAGITSWNVTLVDSTGATAARSFTVTYTPTMALGFTGLSPNAISTSAAGYVPSLLAGGANFTNLTQIRFSWSGATSGSATWIKGDANWPSKVTVSSDTSMTLRPTVTTAGDPAGITSWNVTLVDSTGATAARSFTVTYTPTMALGFTGLSPNAISTSAAGYVPSLLAGGANFTNLTQIRFSWSGATSGSATWIKGDANWPSKVTVSSDTSMTLRPTVTTAGDPAGITSWNVTLVDSTGATAARSFTVTYTPTVALGFTGLSPNAISTSAAGYVPSLLAGGANFTNLTQIRFSWSGATSGSATWIKGDANWPSKVTVSSDTSMTLRPTVTTAGDPAGITSWNVTLVDSTGATAARSFTVTYTPTMALGFTGLSPNAISTSAAGYVPSLLAGGANFTNLTQIRFSWSGATSGSATWIKGDANWPSKVTVSSDTSMTLRPTVTTAGDPAGITSWNVTLVDSTGATAARSFTVTYTPTMALGFTGLSPNAISTSAAGYVPSLLAGGANFTNLTQIRFSWSGATSGSATWIKGDSKWASKVTVSSNTSMTLRPTVTTAGDPAGITSWSVTLVDSTGATAARSFTVTYTR